MCAEVATARNHSINILPMVLSPGIAGQRLAGKQGDAEEAGPPAAQRAGQLQRRHGPGGRQSGQSAAAGDARVARQAHAHGHQAMPFCKPLPPASAQKVQPYRACRTCKAGVKLGEVCPCRMQQDASSSTCQADATRSSLTQGQIGDDWPWRGATQKAEVFR